MLFRIWSQRTMLAKAIIVTVIFFNCSCGSAEGVKKSKINDFGNIRSETFNNDAFKTKGREKGSPTLLELFKIPGIKTDSVVISLIGHDSLQIAYKENSILKKVVFVGKTRRKGDYQIFFNNERKEYPPFFPIFYSVHNIDRIRLAFTADGDLIVDNKWDHTAYCFFMAAGWQGRQKSYFKKI